MVKSPVNAAEPSARVFVIAREPRSRFRLFSTVALVVVFLVMSAGDPVMTGVDQVNPVGAVGRVFSVMVQLNPVGIEFTVPVAPAAMVMLPVLLASLPVAGAHT